MKKNFLYIGLIVTALLSLILVIILWYQSNYTAPENIRNMILEHEDDYTKIAEIYYNDYQNRDANEIAYSAASPSGESYTISSYDELPNIRKISLNETESASAQSVENSYWIDESIWERVYVYDVFVSFSNIRGRESLVYSVDGTRPSYVNSPSDEGKFDHIWVHKITDNWYHVRGNRTY